MQDSKTCFCYLADADMFKYFLQKKYFNKFSGIKGKLLE